MSRPIVVIVCMDAPPNRGSFNSTHIFGTHVPGGGAVHSIITGNNHLSFLKIISGRSGGAAWTRSGWRQWRRSAGPLDLCDGDPSCTRYFETFILLPWAAGPRR